ncbi:hypothetical protein [Marichromatium purpuratum]|uniref:hypothetical protein n=1 Tax=Marichromatium purpuratum TaxID=37487 RepID=UPI0012EB67FD|nr:hypothetical protein [Marichromatium purpuratum]
MPTVPPASKIIIEILTILNEFRNEAGPSKDCFLTLGDVARSIYKKYGLKDGEEKQRVFHCLKSLHKDGFVRIPSLSEPNEKREIHLDKFLINITRSGVEYLETQMTKINDRNSSINISNESGTVNVNSSQSNQEVSQPKDSNYIRPIAIAVAGGLAVAFLAFKLGWAN